MTDSVLEYARSYIKAGIFVFPLYVKQGKDGKKDVRPAVLWRQASSISGADIEAWWGELGEHRNAGIGIDCGRSGLVVVDCDGQEGIANWATLDAAPTWSVRTPGGGFHAYYRGSPDHLIGNDQDGKVAPSVDIRGVGGLVIAAPTVDWRGQYAWSGDEAVDWAALPAVPPIVIERMRAKPAAATATVAEPVQADDEADPLFQPVQREFTREQAVRFIRDARDRLAATAGGLNGAINTFALVCAHFPWLVSRERCAAEVIRTLGEREGWTEPDEQDRKTINSAYTATEEGRSWTAVEVQERSAAAAKTAGLDGEDLEIHGAATMAYWLQDNLGGGRLSGFFLRQGELVHTPRVNEIGYVAAKDGADDNGPAEIRPVTGPTLAAKLQYLFECWSWVPIKDDQGKRTGEKVKAPALFPRAATQVAVDAPEALGGLRLLKGITHTPMVRADGSILDAPGYDPASGYLFLPGPGVNVPTVPDAPSQEDVDSARALLLKMISGFPFATEDDRANYLGLLLTPLLREVAPPSYKMFGIGAHQPGSGKSLLAELVGLIHGAVFRSEVPSDEPEWRKMTTSVLATTSAPAVVLDNVTGVLRSSSLAGLLTASGEIQERELGSMRNLTFRNDRVWIVTGNNLSLGGDLVRRTITILIDPDMANPEQRTDFAITDLPRWVTERRNEVLWALLVLIRAWVSEGMPELQRRQSDSFARWERIVAGVLSVAGVAGSFDAESGKRVAAGGDDDGLAMMLDHLHEAHGDRAWLVAEALAPKAGEFVVDSRDWLPTHVLDKMVRSEAAGRKAMGWWLRNRVGRWVTTDDGRSLVIREAGKDRKGAYWRIEQR